MKRRDKEEPAVSDQPEPQEPPRVMSGYQHLGTVQEFEDSSTSRNSPGHAAVDILHGGVELRISEGYYGDGWPDSKGPSSAKLGLTPDRAVELGRLLLTAGERHSSIRDAIASVQQQESHLREARDILVQELLK